MTGKDQTRQLTDWLAEAWSLASDGRVNANLARIKILLALCMDAVDRLDKTHAESR